MLNILQLPPLPMFFFFYLIQIVWSSHSWVGEKVESFLVVIIGLSELLGSWGLTEIDTLFLLISLLLHDYCLFFCLTGIYEMVLEHSFLWGLW